MERRLAERVGSYLLNAERRAGVTCDVCTTPIAEGRLCRRCRDDHTVFGEALADLVVPVVYGGHTEQSKTLLYGYKTDLASRSGDERRSLILLLLWVAVQLHRPCIERRVGASFDLWTTVPSTQGRSAHPLAGIARRVGLGPGEVRAEAVPEQPADRRATSATRFALEATNLPGRHLLVVDDTWTSGGRAQSLALSARRAGAGPITVVVLARWLTPEWPPTADYPAAHLRRDFDPQQCPVTGGRCP